MVVIDSNNSLKRLDGIGKREVSDTRVFGESDYYLSEEFVNTFADEVRARPKEKPVVETEEEEPEGGEKEWVDEQHGDPTDGDDDPTLRECTDNWKAAAADGAKRMWDAFRESGYFVMACRHGFVLWVADMVWSGELYVSLSFLIWHCINNPSSTGQSIHWLWLPRHSSSLALAGCSGTILGVASEAQSAKVL